MARKTMPEDTLFETIETAATEELKRRGIKESDAIGASLAVSRAVRHTIGGQLIYIKKNRQEETEEKQAEIINDHQNGLAAYEIAMKHKITVQQVYSTIAKFRDSQP